LFSKHTQKKDNRKGEEKTMITTLYG